MTSIEVPDTRHAKAVDGVDLAYQVVGNGSVDVFWSFSQLSDVDAVWEYPPIAAFLRELATFSRLVVHDRRGMGRSGGERGDLEADVADLLLLLDTVGADHPHLVGAGNIGGAIYAAFVNAHPRRVAGLIWHGAQARSAWAPDYPWGETTDELDRYAQRLAEGWGTERFARDFVAGGAPSMAGDAASVRFFAHWMRQTSDARSAAAYNRLWDGIDMRSTLDQLRVPTLITSRGLDPAEGGHVASLIPGASFVALEGADFMPFFDSQPMLATIREFIERRPRSAGPTGT